MINCIQQDHLGFMWFGTFDGLNRFDGYRFTAYRYEHANPASVSGNFITSLFQDSKKRLWIGTALNGLNLFNYETETFTRIEHANLQALKNSRIFSIQEDRNGALWIGTVNGLFKVVIREKKVAARSRPGEGFFEENDVRIIKIVMDSVHPTHEMFRLYEAPAAKDNFESSFYIDSQGVVWVSIPGSLYRIFPSTGAPDSIVPVTSTAFPGLLADSIMKISEDTATGLIYLMHKHAITTLDKQSKRVLRTECPDFNMGISRRQFSLNRDKMWAAHNHKLFYHDLEKAAVRIVRPQSSEHAKMMGYCNHVYRDRSGVLWIGTSGFGLLKFNPVALQFNTVNTKSVIWMKSTPENNVISNAVDFLLLAKDSSTGWYLPDTVFSTKIKKWFGASPPDIGVQTTSRDYYITASSIVRFNKNSKTYTTIGDSSIRFPLFVDRDENIWFGNGSFFCRLNTKTQEISSFQYPVAKISMFPYQFLEAVYQDADGIFWLGTLSGLLRFDEKKNRWKQYTNNPGDKSSLNADVIFSICEDPKFPGRYLWIGTNGGGLNMFDKEKELFKSYTEKDGLANNVVYGILSDNKGNLWMSTNKGLSKFLPPVDGNPKAIFRNYDEDDGLQNNEFNRYAFAKTGNGLFFFGGVSGYNYFNPDDIEEPTQVPQVVITDFKISNKSILFSDSSGKGAILHKPVYLTDRITLPYSRNIITFDFAEMDFTHPAKNRFQYRMEGFDKEWVTVDNSHSATFTNLDPGKYSFSVRSISDAGITYNNETSVDVIILPPWYMTWWFRLLAVGATFAAVYAFYRYRIRQALKLMEMRNRIADDLHDEIGSTLSSIHIYSEVALSKMENKSEETANYLTQISHETGGIIEALGDIVWTVNPKNDRFEDIINRMRAITVELFEARNIQLHMYDEEKIGNETLVMIKRKNFYLFYKEAVNNIVKYAEAKNVWVKMDITGNRFYLSIKDDGIGFDTNSKTTGNGLFSMKKRSVELGGEFDIQSAPGLGTVVYLSFPL